MMKVHQNRKDSAVKVMAQLHQWSDTFVMTIDDMDGCKPDKKDRYAKQLHSVIQPSPADGQRNDSYWQRLQNTTKLQLEGVENWDTIGDGGSHDHAVLTTLIDVMSRMQTYTERCKADENPIDPFEVQQFFREITRPHLEAMTDREREDWLKACKYFCSPFLSNHISL